MPEGNSNMLAATAIQVNTDYANAIRFPAWLALAVFSIICLVALTTELDSVNRGSEEKFCIAVLSISLVCSLLSVAGYVLVRGIFAGTTFELIVIGLVGSFWGVGLFYIMAPDNRIAVSGGAVTNANLYFFSWICFVVVVFLLMSYLQESMGIDARQAPGKQARWFFFFAASLVVMGVSARLYSSATGCAADNHNEKYCKRTKYAISLGTISCISALAMTLVIFRGLSAAAIEFGVTNILMVMWTFGVGFITFGNAATSPGTMIGNLYFSTWISFLLCVNLFVHSIAEFLGMSPPVTSSTTEPENLNSSNNGNVPGEEDF